MVKYLQGGGGSGTPNFVKVKLNNKKIKPKCAITNVKIFKNVLTLFTAFKHLSIASITVRRLKLSPITPQKVQAGGKTAGT